MSCECYKIGGPWISYDPNCPTHGDEAQRERNAVEKELREKDDLIEQLRERIDTLENRVLSLEISNARY